MGALEPKDVTSVSLKMMRISQMHRMITRSAFQYFGLTPGQPPILHYLSNHDGCIQRELAEHNHHRAASISTVIDSMERTGLVERRKDEKDRRVFRVFLTEKGKRIHTSIKKVFNTMDTAMTGDMTPEERERLLSFLDRVIGQMTKLKEENQILNRGKELSDEETDTLH
ncbi:MAG: MarR family winged helix-turn-helix transcriptional regulator [Christensenellales bacterium]|jgi:DNA-binding MarR family transcriptional regulator